MSNQRNVLGRLLVGLSVLTLAGPVQAQLSLPEPSPPATVQQKIGFTDLTITYSRPAVKGRTVFGGLVPFGQLWRTGASDATTLMVTDSVMVGGKPLPAGNYSLVTIPNRQEWTVILNRRTDGHGLSGYDEKDDVLRFTAKADSSSRFYESFTIEVQDVIRGQATMLLHWANTSIRFPIVSNADQRIRTEIHSLINLKKEHNPTLLYQAAQYVYDQQTDTESGLKWIASAIVSKPAFNYLHLQAKLLARSGDYKGAIAAARRSATVAQQEKFTDYVTLNNRLIAEWEKKL